MKILPNRALNQSHAALRLRLLGYSRPQRPKSLAVLLEFLKDDHQVAQTSMNAVYGLEYPQHVGAVVACSMRLISVRGFW